MNRPRSLLFITLATTIFWVRPVHLLAGDGVVRNSLGATAAGRGGTNIAHSDNGAVLLDNPAGLVNMTGTRRLELGLDLLFTDLDYTDPQNNDDGKVAPYPLPQLSYAEKSDNERWAYGIGLFAPAGFGASYKLHHWLYGKKTYESMGALIKLLPAVAYKIDDRLSVGGTFGLAISHAQLRMPFHLQTGLFSGLPTLMELKATGLAPTWSAGLQYQLSQDTTIGLAYRGETRLKLHGPCKVDVAGLNFPLLTSKYSAEVDLVWPASLGLGITHRLAEKHRLSADVIWFDWSHAFDKLDIKMTRGSNPLFNLMLGPKVKDRLALDWHDSVAARFGYEYWISPKDVLRAGYSYHPTPVPDATLLPILAGILDHTFSVGYGHQWQQWRIDLAYQYSFSRTHHVSNSRIVGADFDHSSNKAQAHWFYLALSYRF